MTIINELVIEFVLLTLTVSLVISIIIILKSKTRLDEWERRIFISVFFFIVSELSGFISDVLIQQLARITFIVSLLYALMYVFTFEKTIRDLEKRRMEFISDLSEMEDLSELQEVVQKELKKN